MQQTGLSFSQVWHGLAVLIQQDLTLWATDASLDATFYEANTRSAYNLVRSGKFTNAIEARLGRSAGLLFQECLNSLHFRASDLQEAHHLERVTTAKKMTNGIISSTVFNGVSKDVFDGTASPSELLHENLYRLLQDQFLCLAHPAHFRPEAENRTLAEEAARRIKSDWSEKIKRKDEAQFEEAVETILKAWFQGKPSEKSAIKDRRLHSLDHGLKRRFEDDSDDDEEEEISHAAKRPRLANGVPKTNGVVSHKIDAAYPYIHEDIVMRVNGEKFAVTARTDKLIHHVKQRIGHVTALVYGAFLARLEGSIYQCQEEKQDKEAEPSSEWDDGRRLKTNEVVACIKNLDELEGGIGKVDASKVDIVASQHRKEHRRRGKKRKRSLTEFNSDPIEESSKKLKRYDRSIDVDGEPSESSDSTSDEDNQPDSAKSKLVRQHLLLLAESSLPFLLRHPATATHPEAWSVPFRTLASHLRLLELNSRISSTYGTTALRLVRLLQEKGKLDDKTIRNYALLTLNDVRHCLMQLATAGYVEQQEVPRDNNRQPSRTIWLWFFDAERCGKKVLEETYQAMARILQRLKVEREAEKDLLNKASRTDVVGREEQILAEADLKALAIWRAKEERLLAELGRLDDVVLVLRDFQGL